jgi:uncharacterized membrane protein YvlD (DUF360 family)
MGFYSANYFLILGLFTLIIPGVLLALKTKNLNTNKLLNVLLIGGAVFVWAPYLLTIANPSFQKYLATTAPIGLILLIAVSAIKIYLIVQGRKKS